MDVRISYGTHEFRPNGSREKHEIMNAPRCPIHDFPVSRICPACAGAATSDRKVAGARAKGKLGGKPVTKKPRKRAKE